MSLALAELPGATGRLLADKPHYVNWGVIQISVANLLIIVAMLVLFLLALVLPFPGSDKNTPADKELSEQPDV